MDVLIFVGVVFALGVVYVVTLIQRYRKRLTQQKNKDGASSSASPKKAPKGLKRAPRGLRQLDLWDSLIMVAITLVLIPVFFWLEPRISWLESRIFWLEEIDYKKVASAIWIFFVVSSFGVRRKWFSRSVERLTSNNLSLRISSVIFGVSGALFTALSGVMLPSRFRGWLHAKDEFDKYIVWNKQLKPYVFLALIGGGLLLVAIVLDQVERRRVRRGAP